MINNLLIKTIISTSLATLMLTSCGFQLRGLPSNSMQSQNSHINALQTVEVTVQSEDKVTANNVRKLLSNRLNTHGITTTTSKKIGGHDGHNLINASQYKNTVNSPLQEASSQYSAISIDDVAFQQLQLVGVLTEISISISANITYQGYDEQGQHSVIRRPLTIKKSYQYNQASVNTNRQQEHAIKQWLRESLVQHINDQFIALNNNRPSTS